MMKTSQCRSFSRASPVAFVALAFAAHATLAEGQVAKVAVRGVPDTVVFLNSDTARMAVSARQKVVIQRMDSLLKLQNNVPIGSSEYARIERELQTSLLSILPGGSAFVASNSFVILGAEAAAAMKRNALSSPRIMMSVAARGWIGLNLDGFHREPWAEPDGTYVQYFEYPTVIGVDPGSPAAKGGVKFGDLLLAYDGIDLRRNAVNLTRLLEPGKNLAVKLRRDGETRELSILVERAPPGAAIAPTSAVTSGMLTPSATMIHGDSGRRVVEGQARAGGFIAAAPRAATGGVGGRGPGLMLPTMISGGIMGASITEIEPAGLARLTHQTATHGVIVGFVAAGSPAERLGLLPGDVIVGVDDVDVTSYSQLVRELNARRSNKSTQFVVIRDGKLEKLQHEPR